MSTQPPDDTVYVRRHRGGSAPPIHTNPDCPYLRKAARVFEHPRSRYGDDRPVCKRCSGDVTKPEPDHSTNQLLQNTDWEELGL